MTKTENEKSILKKDLRAEIVRKMKRIVEVFPELDPTGMKIDHFLAIYRLKHTDLDTISDIRLIMLCGAQDHAFMPGSYGYTADQNMALNDLEDSLCELRNL